MTWDDTTRQPVFSASNSNRLFAESAQTSTRLSTRLRVRVPCQCSSPRSSKFISPLFFGIIFCRLHYIAQTLSRPSQTCQACSPETRKKKYLPNARRPQITHHKLRPGACPGGRRRCRHCHCHCRNPSLFLVLQSFGSIPHLAPPAACTQLPSSRAALAALESQSELDFVDVSPKKTSRFATILMSRKSNDPWMTIVQKQLTSQLHFFFRPESLRQPCHWLSKQLHTNVRLIESRFGCCRCFVPNKS